METTPNSELHSRRNFLRNSASATAGAALAGLLAGEARAIEPVRRAGDSQFKFSLAAYSYRDLLAGRSPELTLKDFVSDCARMGLQGTELTSYYFPPNPSDEYINDLKAHCFREGLDVSGTAVGNDFCHPPGEERDKQIAQTKKWVDYAAKLGAPVIRIFSGTARNGQTVDQAHALAVAAIEECCAYAGDKGVFLALENHGGLTTTVDGLLKLVQDVQSPWFGVNLDSGNFRTDDVYGDLAKIAPYSINVQIKVMIQPRGGRKEPSDLGKLAAILREAGYRGYVALEFEEDEDPRVACPRWVDAIRAAFA
jgi:sugar phosphate isomerase/epimerase